VVARPSRWGNPYRIGDPATPDRASAVEKFRATIAARAHGATARELGPMKDYPTDEDIAHALAGHDLACWCPLDEPCHADVLLRIANRRSGGRRRRG
jgi:hypothetical protein